VITPRVRYTVTVTMTTVSKKKSPHKAPSAVPTDQPASKKKKLPSQQSVIDPGTELVDSNTSSPVPFSENDSAPVSKQYVFKNPNFTSSNKNAGKRGPGHRAWKTLKQILVNERATRKSYEVTYESLDAPPSFKPAKKYSDLSGLPSHYRDPQSKIRYATTDEFSRIKMLPSDIVAGYLTLRKANLPVP